MSVEASARKLDRRLVILGGVAGCFWAAPTRLLALEKLKVRDVVTILMRVEEGRRPDLSRRDLSGLNLADLDFKNADLSDSNLFGVDLTGSNLEGVDLSRAVLDRATLVRTLFTGATLAAASIRRPSVTADLNFASRDLPVFRRANLTGVRLTAQLDGADFSGADLSGASFVFREERDLGGAPTTGLTHCDFTAARMRGVNVRGLSLAHSSFRNADLSGADLRDTDLTGADLTGAVLDGAMLDGARLEALTGLPSTSGD